MPRYAPAAPGIRSESRNPNLTETSSRLVAFSFLSGGMLKARLSRRAGVVRVLGSFRKGGPRVVTSAFPGCLMIRR
jgi:hypothetical protein